MNNQIPVSMSWVLHNKPKQKCCCSLLRCRLPFETWLSLNVRLKENKHFKGRNITTEKRQLLLFESCLTLYCIVGICFLTARKTFNFLVLSNNKRPIALQMNWPILNTRNVYFINLISSWPIKFVRTNTLQKLKLDEGFLSWYHCLVRHWWVCWGRMFCCVFHIFCQKMLLADIFMKKTDSS